MIPRDYQDRCGAALDDSLQEHQCSLVVMATGTGKTIVFAHEIRKRMQHGRVMVVAHREELLRQASDKINRVCGITPDMEMAEWWADDPNHGGRSPVIVASVQTLNSGADGDGRMKRFNPDDFGLLIIDEAHHSPAVTYRKVIDHFTQNPRCKVLGVTATPDRKDEKAMGMIYTDCAYDYDILDAVRDGWLVKPMANHIHVHDLDFSGIRTTAGELNGADLEEVMNDEGILHRIAGPTFEIADGRRTLVFATSCANAERLCEIFNRHKADSARYVDGKTDRDVRRGLLEDYRGGRFSILCNVGVATEGFDVPGIEVVVPRPTKSRALFAQMIGRGTRPIDGLVDQYDTAEDRRAAIADSTKPALEVLDFCGVSGRHKLVHTADILGGKFDDDVVERANEIMGSEEGACDVETALDRARREHEISEAEAAAAQRRSLSQESRRGVKGRARYTLSKVDLFDTLEVTPMRLREWDVGKVLSEKQAGWLRKNKVDPSEMNYSEARAVLNQLGRRMKLNVATVPMQKLLQKHGWWDADLNYDEAHRRINAIKENGWRRPREVQHV